MCAWNFVTLKDIQLESVGNRVLRRIFRPKRDELTDMWKNYMMVGFHNLYYSPNFIRITKSWRVRWAGRVVRIGEMRNA